MIKTSDFGDAFSILDFTIVLLMLLISMGIGFYNGFKRRNKTNNELEYLMGGRKMSVFPVGLSILASLFSGLTLTGLSTEMYLYGFGFTFHIINNIVIVCLFNKYILPIFHGLQITSIYHYLEKRFDRRVRLFGSVAFIIQATLYMPILLYLPSLSFNQMTGIDIKITGSVLAAMVIIYTCLGGFRATVWTDVFQCVVMIASMAIVLVKGYWDLTKQISAKDIFQLSYETDRYKFPTFNLDPTIRISFWSLSIGGLSYSSYITCSQLVLQRCLSLPTLAKARKASWVFAILSGSIFLIGFFGGTLLVSVFRECDPKTAGIIQENDQLIPLLVLMISRTLPGLSGILMGGLFCASLSSISSFLNSLAAVILEDFCKTFFGNRLSQRSKNILMRCVVLFFGLTTIPLIVIAQNTNILNQFAVAMESITNGAILGIFFLGIFFPSIDGKCALIGGVSSLLLVGWISFSANQAISAGDLTFDTKFLPHEGCPEMFNVTVNTLVENVEKSDVMFLFRISYWYYILVGIITTISVAFLMRLILGGNSPGTIDRILTWPPKAQIEGEEESSDMMHNI